jgi:predicted nucleotidyltransferase
VPPDVDRFKRGGNQRLWQALLLDAQRGPVQDLVRRAHRRPTIKEFLAKIPGAADVEIVTDSSAIRAAFVYGSVARAEDRSASDIDLMVISDSLTYGDVFGALDRVTKSVGRQVNPTVYTAAEFAKRARGENAFVTKVLQQPKIWVIGSEHDLPVAARAARRGWECACEGGSKRAGVRGARTGRPGEIEGR